MLRVSAACRALQKHVFVEWWSRQKFVLKQGALSLVFWILNVVGNFTLGLRQ
jgi:hypothetical protein